MSHRLLLCSLALSFGTGCSKESAGALFDGNWVGTATDAAGVPVPMLAAFTYDEAATPSFYGTLQHADYLYNVNGASSADSVATISAISSFRSIELSGVTVEETTMSGSYTVDACYGQVPPNPDPACKLPGTFTMEGQ